MIESFYSEWYEAWGPEIGEGQCKFGMSTRKHTS